MGEVVMAAKVCHVPSMYLSELPGKHHGCREAAIAGHKEIARRARELGADTAVVFDVHWLVNSGYHINCGEAFNGTYTSNELPHFIKNMTYDYQGCPELGELIAAEANAADVRTLAHNIPSLELEYGTLVPMRYMHMDVPAAEHLKVVSIAAWCAWHRLEDSFTFGAAVRRAIEKSDRKVLVLASGSLPTVSPTTARPRPTSTTGPGNSTSRWTSGWWSCGSRAASASSAPCSRTTPAAVMARAECTIRPCSWGCWAGLNTTAQRRSSLRCSAAPAPARSTPSSLSRPSCHPDSQAAGFPPATCEGVPHAAFHR